VSISGQLGTTKDICSEYTGLEGSNLEVFYKYTINNGWCAKPWVCLTGSSSSNCLDMYSVSSEWANLPACTASQAGANACSSSAHVTTFAISNKQNGLHLRWTATDEASSAGWEIYRSSDGENFSIITNEPIAPYQGEYDYLDKDVRNGKRYEYILRELDLSGRVEQQEPIWALYTRADLDKSRRIDGYDLLSAIASGNKSLSAEIARDFGSHTSGKGRRPEHLPERSAKMVVSPNGPVDTAANNLRVSKFVTTTPSFSVAPAEKILVRLASENLDEIHKGIVYPFHMKRKRIADEKQIRSTFGKIFQQREIRRALNGAILEPLDFKQASLRLPRLFKTELVWTTPKDRFVIVYVMGTDDKLLIVQRKVLGQWRTVGLYD